MIFSYSQCGNLAILPYMSTLCKMKSQRPEFLQLYKLPKEYFLSNLSGWKVLTFPHYASPLSMSLKLLQKIRRCISTKDFKTIGVKSWVLVLKTLGVALIPCASV